jgi:Zn ribbon nucleic-acid-binding protein
MTSEFLYHTNCPNCGSRDNLGIYTDHKWCFGCGYWEGEQKQVNRLLTQQKENNDNNNLGFPSDFDYHIPVDGVNWLQQYSITQREIHDNRFGWSQNGKLIRGELLFSPCLVFPVYDEYGNLLMWQARYFGENPRIPKYYTRGAKGCVHLLGRSGPLVLTEDLISAIKVSRVARAVPLWGSSANFDLLVRLSRLTDELIIWLDHDKAGKDAHRIVHRALQCIPKVRCIDTPLDPKCYDTEAIRGHLHYD